MNNLTAADIAAALKGKQEGDGWRSLCPAHDDKTPSLSISEKRGKILVFCHAGCAQEAVIAALKKRNLWPQRKPTAIYDYRSEADELLYQVVRLQDPKEFRQRRPDGGGRFTWGRGKVPHVPFQLQNMLKNPDAAILIVEGEKDVLNLMKLGFIVTCNDSGAGKFSTDLVPYFHMRRVVLLPDNDEAGRAHVDDAASKLRGVAAEIRLLELPGLPPKGDASDWIRSGGTKEQLQALIEAAPLWQPAARQEPREQGGDDEAEPVNTKRAKQWIEVIASDLPATAKEVVSVLSKAERLFERARKPVKLVDNNKVLSVEEMVADNAIMELHELAQPYRIEIGEEGEPVRVPVTLPLNVARMWMAKRGEWRLRQLTGFTSAPLLRDDGSIRFVAGYDAETQMWCHNVVTVDVPERPSRGDAEVALHLLRWLFRSFPFADAETVPGDPTESDPDFKYTTPVVDLSKAPKYDESAAILALLTAIARASLRLAPALLLNAPKESGSGTGKGLLFRTITMIATGALPYVSPPGHDDAEFDKRVVTAVLGGHPMVLFDNFNSRNLANNTIASLITERPSHLRPLGVSKFIEVNSAAFLCLSGNGLNVAEDLMRRFITLRLNARMEEPRKRQFDIDALPAGDEWRALFLEAALTIWRWGRQNAAEISKGEPFGSFETWALWCRDPLLALGCADPIARISELRAQNQDRNMLYQFLEAWHSRHGDVETHLSDVDTTVRRVADPDQKMSQREFQAFVEKHLDSTVGPYQLVLGLPQKKRIDGRLAGRPVNKYRVTKSKEIVR